MRNIDDFVTDKETHWEFTEENLQQWYNECILPEEEPTHPFDKWVNEGTPPIENIRKSMESGILKYKGKPFKIV